MRKLGASNKAALQSTCKDKSCHDRESRFLHRLHCVLLVAEDISCYQVAEWFGEHPRTIERWAHQYNESGISGLRDEEKRRPAKIGIEQRKRLQTDIFRGPCELGYNQNGWDGKLLQTHLEHSYGIELSVRQCQRILKQLQPSVTIDTEPA